MSTEIKGGRSVQRNMFEDEDTTFDRPDPDVEIADPGTPVDLSPADSDDRIEIEVVDDTPEDDRGRPDTPPEAYDDPDGGEGEGEGEDEGAEEPPEAASEQELRQHSAKTVKRIKKLTFERETERRAREKAERERNELVNLTKQLIDDNKRLETSLGESTTSLVDSMKRGNEAALEAATEEFQAAYEAGDAKAMAAAQRKMARFEAEGVSIKARAEAIEAEARKAPAEQPAQPNGYQPVQSAPIHPKTTAWLQNNQWFQSPGREEMTSFALGVHEGLKAEGVDPTTDEYYRRLDSRLAEVYPEFFEGRRMAEKDKRSRDDKRAATSRSPVAPGSRKGAGTQRKVRLTSSEVSIARRLNLTPEQYARQKLKDQANA